MARSTGKVPATKPAKKKNAESKAEESSSTKNLLGRVPTIHLLPFVILVGISFAFFLPIKPSVATMPLERMILKCLPVVYLAAYIGITDRGRGESGSVFHALLFSAIGDGFLAYHDTCFIFGLAAFAIAHTLYARTFGFKSMSLILGGALHITNFLILHYLAVPYVQNVSFRVAMSIYSLFLVTMAWRALDRYFFTTYPCNERRLCSALGGVSFAFSDSCYVFLQMLGTLPHIPAQVIILSTYYLSQVLLMLGSSESFWAQARSKSKKKK